MYDVDSPIVASSKARQPLFFSLSSHESLDDLPLQWQDWLKQEDIRAMALIPAGDARFPNGVFVIGFSKLIGGFWSEMEQTLRAFGQTMTHYLRNSGDRLSVYQQNFLTHFVNLHMLMSAEDLGRGSLSHKLDGVDQMTYAVVKDLGARLLRVINRFYKADEMRPPHGDHPSLKASLDNFRRAVTDGRNPSAELEWRVDAQIELESLELKVILYQCLAEAALNSLNHGKATKIYIRVARLRHCIWLVIADDGCGFDVKNAASRLTKTHDSGINHMVSCIQELCGASEIDWEWTAPGKGACLRLVIPMLPDPNLPEKIIVQDHMDALEKLHDKETHSSPRPTA